MQQTRKSVFGDQTSSRRTLAIWQLKAAPISALCQAALMKSTLCKFGTGIDRPGVHKLWEEERQEKSSFRRGDESSRHQLRKQLFL